MLHPALVSANGPKAWPQPGHCHEMHGRAVSIGGLAGEPKLMAEFTAAGAHYAGAGADLGLLLASGTAWAEEIRTLKPG